METAVGLHGDSSGRQGPATLKPGWLRTAYLKYLSQPSKDRNIYRLIDSGKIKSISEFGLGTGLRTRRMIEIAVRHHVPQDIRYAGFDMFESRGAGQPGMTLKQAHRHLAATGVLARLVPGEIIGGLLRIANLLPQTDLVIISRDVDQLLLETAWFYFPRMLHEHSVVMLESGNVRPEFQTLTLTQVSELARRAASTVRRAS
jgi:hypothetical protein